MKTYKRRRVSSGTYLLITVLIAGTYAAWAILRPLPVIQPTIDKPTLNVQAGQSNIVWPAKGQSATGIVGSQSIKTNGSQTALPIASTVKLITSLSVLNENPMQLGQQGPTITLGPKDVAIYNNYVANDGSVVKVIDGEQISLYQTLQTIMLSSANNMSDSMAIWAFGSLDEYGNYANSFLSKNDIKNTQVGSDASGLAPSSKSTAEDLVKIGKLSMQNPVLAEIAGQTTASGIPVVGNIKNVNFLLGSNGIIGVKTGNTEEAGGAYVAAAKVKVNDKTVTIVTSVIGAPDLFSAMSQTIPLINSAQANFTQVQLIKPGQVLGYYDVPWGQKIPAVADSELKLKAEGGTKVAARVTLNQIPATAEAEATIGTVLTPASVTTSAKSISAKLQKSIPNAPLTWRLIHPF